MISAAGVMGWMVAGEAARDGVDIVNRIVLMFCKKIMFGGRWFVVVGVVVVGVYLAVGVMLVGGPGPGRCPRWAVGRPAPAPTMLAMTMMLRALILSSM